MYLQLSTSKQVVYYEAEQYTNTHELTHTIMDSPDPVHACVDMPMMIAMCRESCDRLHAQWGAAGRSREEEGAGWSALVEVNQVELTLELVATMVL